MSWKSSASSVTPKSLCRAVAAVAPDNIWRRAGGEIEKSDERCNSRAYLHGSSCSNCKGTHPQGKQMWSKGLMEGGHKSLQSSCFRAQKMPKESTSLRHVKRSQQPSFNWDLCLEGNFAGATDLLGTRPYIRPCKEPRIRRESYGVTCVPSNKLHYQHDLT